MPSCQPLPSTLIRFVVSPPILVLHDVTATVDDAKADLDFALDAPGMRFVKRTVSFDNRGEA